MYIDIGEGWHINLAYVARIHVVDNGGAGTSIKFYSATNQPLGDFNPSSPEDLAQVLNAIRSYGRRENDDS